MTPEQSTENRGVTHNPHNSPPPTTKQASKQTDESQGDGGQGEEIGKKGKRQSWDIGSN